MSDDTLQPPKSGFLATNVLQGGNLALLLGFAMVVRDASEKEMRLLEETQVSVVRLEGSVDHLGERFQQLEDELRSLKARVESSPSQDDVHRLEKAIEKAQQRLIALERCARSKRDCDV